MRGYWRRVWWGVALATCLLIASAPNAAARMRLLSASGSLTFTWQGDPARGCAASGLCGVHGELILRPGSGNDGIPMGNGTFGFTLATQSAVRVIREAGGATLGECTEPGVNVISGLTIQLRGRSGSASLGPPASSGQCAGPTAADLESISFPARRTGAGIDLTGERTFNAGPFTVSAVSTLRLSPATPPPIFGSQSFSSSSGPGSPARPNRSLFEFVHLDYRVTGESGALRTSFNGATDPSCQILDACGASGTVTFSLLAPRSFSVFGLRRIRRRVSMRQALAAFRSGQLDPQAYAPANGEVSETYAWPGTTGCSDAVRAPSAFLNLGGPPQSPRGPVLPVVIESNGAPGVEMLRTHCPGPAESNASGNEVIARGAITATQLLSSQPSLVLSNPGDFSGLSYVGSRSGSIRLDLKLVNVRAGTQG